MRGSKRRELETLFAANRRLFKAYVLREQLDRLWTYKTRRGVLNFLEGWIKALRWQRLPETERLATSCFATWKALPLIVIITCGLGLSSRSTRRSKRPSPRARHARRGDAAAQAQMGHGASAPVGA